MSAADEVVPAKTEQAAYGGIAIASSGIAIALGIGLQILTTLPIGADGLRVSLSDLLLPGIMAIALVTWIRDRSSRPSWRFAQAPIWLAAITLWLMVALVLGYRANGQLVSWAWYNKGLGWFVLLSYFAVGACLTAYARPEAREMFFRWFLGFASISVAYSMLLHTGLRAQLIDQWTIPRADAGPVLALLGFVYGGDRLSGFMVNPNAFGFALANLVILHLSLMRHGYAYSPWMHRIGAAICIAGLFGSGSRTAWVAAIAGVAALSAMRGLVWREFLRITAMAIAIVAVFMVAMPEFLSALTGTSATSVGVQAMRGIVYDDAGALARVDLLRDAIALWRDAPIMGTGLGVSAAQTAMAGGEVQYAHSTYLWLLTETGVVGLSLWVGFLVFALRALLRDRRQDDSGVGAAIIAIMVVFVVMSFGMEAMYQRHIWLLLGIGLAVPAARAAAMD